MPGQGDLNRTHGHEIRAPRRGACGPGGAAGAAYRIKTCDVRRSLPNELRRSRGAQQRPFLTRGGAPRARVYLETSPWPALLMFRISEPIPARRALFPASPAAAGGADHVARGRPTTARNRVRVASRAAAAFGDWCGTGRLRPVAGASCAPDARRWARSASGSLAAHASFETLGPGPGVRRIDDQGGLHGARTSHRAAPATCCRRGLAGAGRTRLATEIQRGSRRAGQFDSDITGAATRAPPGLPRTGYVRAARAGTARAAGAGRAGGPLVDLGSQDASTSRRRLHVAGSGFSLVNRRARRTASSGGRAARGHRAVRPRGSYPPTNYYAIAALAPWRSGTRGRKAFTPFDSGRRLALFA